MKKIIIITLILIFSLSLNSYAGYSNDGSAVQMEKQLLSRMKELRAKSVRFKCSEFEKLPQEHINKCTFIALQYLSLELDYTDFIQDMVADRLDLYNKGVFANKKPRNFYDQ